MNTETIITSVITLLAVWFGFFLSNKNNDKLEKKEKIKKIVDLQLTLNLLETYIVAYEQSMGKEKIIDDIPCIQHIDIPFSAELKEYSFLSNYNIHFPNLLDVISRQNSHIHNLVNHYINSIKSHIDIYYSDKSISHKERSKKDLEKTYNHIKDAIRGLRILIIIYNKTVHSSILYNYNVLYDSRLNIHCQSISFENILNFEEHQLYKNWIQIIEDGNVNPPNFRCFICNIEGKIINFFKQIKFYFTHIPINCHKNTKKK